MNDLVAQPAVMTMTLEITRAATGKTEVVEVVCTPIQAPQTEQQTGDNACQQPIPPLSVTL